MGQATVPLCLTSLILIMAFTQSVPATGSSQAPLPEWTEGDYWQYQAILSFAGVEATITRQDEVLDVKAVTVNGTSYEVYEVLSESWAGPDLLVTLDASSVNWYRTSDLASVQTVVQLDGLPNITVRYDPPLGFQWPLQMGRQWTIEGTLIREEASETSYEQFGVNVRVDRKERIEVPAGTFDTYVLVIGKAGGGEGQSQYHAPEAGNFVRMTSPEPEPLTWDLVEYEFANAPHRDETTYPTGISLLGIDLLWLVLTVVVVVAVIVVFVRGRRSSQIEAEPERQEVDGRLSPSMNHAESPTSSDKDSSVEGGLKES